MIAIVLMCFASLLAANAQRDWAYKLYVLQMHNSYRQAHQAPSLYMDPNLNNIAQQCAQYYLTRGTIDHSCPYKSGAGENLYQSSGLTSVAAVAATELWYNEVRLYSYNNPGFSEATGHFTQVVWKASRSLGFAIASDGMGNTVACALYSPPGNFGYAADYAANVSP